MLAVRPVTSATDRRRFLRLPWSIYQNDPAWVPPLLAEERKRIDPARNPFFQHATVQLFLAERDGHVVGRIGASVDHTSNEFHNEQIGLFGFYEAINDTEVAAALLGAARDWLTGQGVDAMRGPIDLSTNDMTGLLIEGLGESPVVLMRYNPSYYRDQFEAFGLTKEKDIVSLDPPIQEMAGKVERVARIAERKGYTVRPFRKNKFSEEILCVRDVYNAAWEKNWGFVPMNDAEFDFMAEGLKQILDPRIALIAEKEGEPVGLCLALPDVNQILGRANGRLFPFGWLTLLLASKSIHRARFIIVGVKKEHRNRGVEGLLYQQVALQCLAAGYDRSDCGWVLEDNHDMINSIETLGGHPYRTYRIYRKELSPQNG